jgi:hypothetical protein
MEKEKGVEDRINIREVVSSKQGKRDKATVIHARLQKSVPRWALDWLGVTPENPELVWKILEDDKTKERVVILMRGKKE